MANLIFFNSFFPQKINLLKWQKTHIKLKNY